LTPEVLADALAAVDAVVARTAGRVIVGIAGPPGAGKSTLGVAVATGRGVMVPMDGFHLANAELRRLGRADRKGAPDTFDVAGFVHLLRRLRAADPDETVYAPAFTRALEEPVAGTIPVAPYVRLVVVEGNYLLVPDGPWAAVRPLLDLAIYLDAPDRSRTAALVRRARARGLDDEATRDWVYRNDEANARLVTTTRDRADVVLTRRT
jgi:pantothenate kinase